MPSPDNHSAVAFQIESAPPAHEAIRSGVIGIFSQTPVGRRSPEATGTRDREAISFRIYQAE